ncbi:MAG TPA: 3-hydroxyanthranilate 3,4-dioxygenase [Nevskiaceae bacterium]|nr:3-hydroxyanthranilate 3,4-dioxygenase [Nevskiaceae bacterium]
MVSAFNLRTWINDHRALLKPPVGNKCIVDDDFIVMIVGGPNARTDYHVDEGAEFFYQLEGHMVLRIQEDGKRREIPIEAGDALYLPPRVPHSPKRFANSVGLVIERRRRPTEKDGLVWYCGKCNTKLYEEAFTLHSIETDFPPVFSRYHAAVDGHACATCGFINEPT